MGERANVPAVDARRSTSALSGSVLTYDFVQGVREVEQGATGKWTNGGPCLLEGYVEHEDVLYLRVRRVDHAAGDYLLIANRAADRALVMEECGVPDHESALPADQNRLQQLGEPPVMELESIPSGARFAVSSLVRIEQLGNDALGDADDRHRDRRRGATQVELEDVLAGLLIVFEPEWVGLRSKEGGDRGTQLGEFCIEPSDDGWRGVSLWPSHACTFTHHRHSGTPQHDRQMVPHPGATNPRWATKGSHW